MVLVVIIVSFILDSVMSNFISLNSFFTPLFTLMSLIIVYPYFKGNQARFFGTCFLTGVFYDLIYSDTIVIHGFLFLMIGFIITRINLVLANNYLNVMIMAIICIIFYRFVAYGLLLITANVSFHWVAVLKSIYHSLIANVIYVALAYIVTDKISLKFKIHKSN